MATNTAQTTASTQHVPAGEHGKGFPPFDPHHFPSQLFWLVLTFIALYLLMSRLALPRIASIIEARRRHIDYDLANAERLKGQSDAAIAAHEKALSNARGQAQTLANETRAKAAAAAAERRKQAEAKINLQIAASEKTISAKRAAAMAQLGGIAEDAANAIVERLMGSAPPHQEIAQAVNAAIGHG
jgi:F-type H+-transporting ATPase subunit b